DGRVEIGHRQREVLAQRRRRVRLDEVDLLPASVEPGPAEAEVRPVGALGQAEYPGVEVQRRRDVTDVERDMVQPVWSHNPSVAGSTTGGQPRPRASPDRYRRPGGGQPAVGSVTRPRNSGSPLRRSVIANRNG